MYHSVASSVLGLVPRLSQTGRNGLLGRGSMFILGTEAFSRLLALSPRRGAGASLSVGPAATSSASASPSTPAPTAATEQLGTRPFGGHADAASRESCNAASNPTRSLSLDPVAPAADNHSTGAHLSARGSSSFSASSGSSSHTQARVLLDIGAGDGNVTRRLAPLFDEVHATETSAPMCWRLSRAGFRVLGVDAWARAGTRYEARDVILCLISWFTVCSVWFFPGAMRLVLLAIEVSFACN